MGPHALDSVRRILVGLAIAVSIGLPVGLAVGGSRLFAETTSMAFQFIRMVSPLSWTPLAIVLLGVGDAPVYFLVAIAGVWPIILNTSAGIAALDPAWISVGRSLGATRWELFKTIVWPGIRPHILTAVGLAIGISWIVLVPAEMLGGDSGLGYFVLNARDRLDYPGLMATIIVIGICGFLLDAVARRLLRQRRRRSRQSTSSPEAFVPQNLVPGRPSDGEDARSPAARAPQTDDRT